MSSVDSKLYLVAVKEAQAAVEFDESGQYRKAINKYQRAADILIQFMKFNKNPEMRRVCQDKVENFVERVKVLKAHLSGPRGRRS
ncbi:MAG: hypothetical protein MUP85_05785, partial [Candidatus Lokiarchaeota archaeon]|nr:hypothetical protein [Candidatus Lokiarchaeota archaeon]